MSGPIALHGGGEFQAGDEPFLRRLLELAGAASRGRETDDPVRIAIVPTAAARGRPSLVGAHGVGAFERVAASGTWAAAPLAVRVDIVSVVDAASAADPTLAARLEAADLIHLPGGDPDLIPTILTGTPAWDAICSAHRRGAVLAGASAGAMALAPWTWTPGGGIAGLGLVPGLAVVPHADPASWASAIERFGTWLPAGLGLLGVAERTGAISRPDEPGAWDVVGEGGARWLAARTGAVAAAEVAAADGADGADAAGAAADSTLVVAAGASLRLPS